MAAYVDGEGDPPPELVRYLMIRDWGDPNGQGWMRWPAGLFLRMRIVRNVYNAWKAYTSAKDRVKWLNENPSGGEIVGVVKSYRFGDEEEGPGEGPMDRAKAWERWMGVEDEAIDG